MTVLIGEVIDDQLENRATSSGKIAGNISYFCKGVDPCKGGD